MVHDLATLLDGRGFLSGSEDGSLRVWDVERGQCVRVIQGCALTLYDVAWSRDSSRLASAGSDTLVTMWESDGAITIWDLASGEHLRTLRWDRPYERLNITGIWGLSEAQKASLRALGAFEGTSSDE